MCRLAAYLGEPIPLAEALYRPSHSLQKQAYAPRELVDGYVNVDGTKNFGYEKRFCEQYDS